jgi:hypothetical protein
MMPLPVASRANSVIPARAGISRFGPPAQPQGDAGLRLHDGLGRDDGKGWARGRLHAAAAAAFLLLAACSSHPDAPGATTADEARQLNDAAEMLDANSVDADAVTTNESAP